MASVPLSVGQIATQALVSIEQARIEREVTRARATSPRYPGAPDPVYEAYVRATDASLLPVLGYAQDAWGVMRYGLREEALDLFLQQVLPPVVSMGMQVAQLTSVFIARRTGTRPMLVDPAAIFRRGVALEEEFARPFVAARAALAKGSPLPDALRIGAQRLDQLIQSDAQLAKTQQAQRSLEAVGEERYRRVVRSDRPCPLCLLASMQVYRTKDLMPIHVRCRCDVDVMPPGWDVNDLSTVFIPEEYTEVGPRGGNEDTAFYLKRVAENRGTGGWARRAYGDLIEIRDHGELGPLLTWKAHRFTGPSDFGAYEATRTTAKGLESFTAPVQTFSELKEVWLQRHPDIQLVGFDDFVPRDPIHEQITTLAVRDLLDGVDHVVQRYPGIEGQGFRIEWGGMYHDEAAAETWPATDFGMEALVGDEVLGTRRITLNPNVFADPEYAARAVAEWERNHPLPEGVDRPGFVGSPQMSMYEATGVHEMGHVVSNVAGQRPEGRVDEVLREVFDTDRDRAMYRDDEFDFWKRAQITEYGRYSEAEALAEAFADVELNGDYASTANKALHRMLLEEAGFEPAETVQPAFTFTPFIDLQPSPGSDLVYDAVRSNGGITIDLVGGQPSQGFAFAPSDITERRIPMAEFKESDIDDYVYEFQGSLGQPGNHLGMWVEGDYVYLDISRVGAPSAATIAVAQEAGQLAVFDLENFRDIDVGVRNADGSYTPLGTPTDLLNQHREEVARATDTASAPSTLGVPPGEGPGPVTWTGPPVAAPNEDIYSELQTTWTGTGFDYIKDDIRLGARDAQANGYEGTDLVGWRLQQHLRSKEGKATLGGEIVAMAVDTEPLDRTLYRGIQVTPEELAEILASEQVSMPVSSFFVDDEEAADVRAGFLDTPSKQARGFAIWQSEDIDEAKTESLVIEVEPGAKAVSMNPVERGLEGSFIAPLRPGDEAVAFGQFQILDIDQSNPDVTRIRVRQTSMIEKAVADPTVDALSISIPEIEPSTDALAFDNFGLGGNLPQRPDINHEGYRYGWNPYAQAYFRYSPTGGLSNIRLPEELQPTVNRIDRPGESALREGPVVWDGPPIDRPSYGGDLQREVDLTWGGAAYFDTAKEHMRRGSREAQANGFDSDELLNLRDENGARRKPFVSEVTVEHAEVFGKEMVARAVHAEPTTRTMWRGMGVTQEQLDRMLQKEAGTTVSMPLSSFAKTRDAALAFATADETGWWISQDFPEDAVPVLLKLEKGAKLAPILNHSEYVGFGEFEVVRATRGRADRPATITLRQISLAERSVRELGDIAALDVGRIPNIEVYVDPLINKAGIVPPRVRVAPPQLPPERPAGIPTVGRVPEDAPSLTAAQDFVELERTWRRRYPGVTYALGNTAEYDFDTVKQFIVGVDEVLAENPDLIMRGVKIEQLREGRIAETRSLTPLNGQWRAGTSSVVFDRDYARDPELLAADINAAIDMGTLPALMGEDTAYRVILHEMGHVLDQNTTRTSGDRASDMIPDVLRETYEQRGTSMEFDRWRALFQADNAYNSPREAIADAYMEVRLLGDDASVASRAMVDALYEDLERVAAPDAESASAATQLELIDAATLRETPATPVTDNVIDILESPDYEDVVRRYPEITPIDIELVPKLKKDGTPRMSPVMETVTDPDTGKKVRRKTGERPQIDWEATWERIPYDQLKANWRNAIENAEPWAIEAGRVWYPELNAVAQHWAQKYAEPFRKQFGRNPTPEDVAAIFAAYSQANIWSANLIGTREFMEGRSTTFHRTMAKKAIEYPDGPLEYLRVEGDSPKLYNFASNIAGKYDNETVDRWVARIMLGTNDYGLADDLWQASYSRDKVTYRPGYDKMAEVINDLAKEMDMDASAIQAIPWVHVVGPRGAVVYTPLAETTGKGKGSRAVVDRDLERITRERFAGVVDRVEVQDPLLDLLDPPKSEVQKDIDDIMGFLGVPPGPPPPPSPPRPEQPIPGVRRGEERWYKHLKDVEDTTDNAHLTLPTEMVDRYKEYDRPPELTETLKKAIAEDGVRTPLWISTDGENALLVEGNHRLAVAKDLGIEQLPVRISYDPDVLRNEGNPPVPLDESLREWLRQHPEIRKRR